MIIIPNKWSNESLIEEFARIFIATERFGLIKSHIEKETELAQRKLYSESQFYTQTWYWTRNLYEWFSCTWRSHQNYSANNDENRFGSDFLASTELH